MNTTEEQSETALDQVTKQIDTSRGKIRYRLKRVAAQKTIFKRSFGDKASKNIIEKMCDDPSMFVI